jgi:hypothetical protein
MTIPAIATALNAVSNSSRETVTEHDVIQMLQTGDGKGHLVRALFEDCSRETLETIASSLGLTSKQLVAAYGHAKANHHASNEELDDCID